MEESGKSRIEEWSVDEVAQWLTEAKIDSNSIEKLRDNEVDGYTFIRLTEQDLRSNL